MWSSFCSLTDLNLIKTLFIVRTKHISPSKMRRISISAFVRTHTTGRSSGLSLSPNYASLNWPHNGDTQITHKQYLLVRHRTVILQQLVYTIHNNQMPNQSKIVGHKLEHLSILREGERKLPKIRLDSKFTTSANQRNERTTKQRMQTYKASVRSSISFTLFVQRQHGARQNSG